MSEDQSGAPKGEFTISKTKFAWRWSQYILPKGFRQIGLRGTASNHKSAEFIKRCCAVRGIKLGPDGRVIDEEKEHPPP